MPPINTIVNNVAPLTVPEAQQLLEQYEVAFHEMQQAKEWEEWIDLQDRAELEILEAKMKAAYAILDQYIKTGIWQGLDGTAATDSPETSPEDWDSITRNLEPGWNGDINIVNALPSDYTSQRLGELSEDPNFNGANFAGTVYLEDDGDPANPLEIALQVSDTALRVDGLTHGNDIIYIETYINKDTGTTEKRFWVGKDHAANVRANIMVTANNLQPGRLTGLYDDPSAAITMDFSKVYRISDGSLGFLDPEQRRNGLILIGSDMNDTIIGSQGDDLISGLKGTDTVRAEAGDDSVYGDDGYLERLAAAESARTGTTVTVETIRRQLGLRTDRPDGDDILDGGIGFDTIDGDGGVNTGFASDGSEARHEVKLDNIHNIRPNQLTEPDFSEWLEEGGGWSYSRRMAAGVYEVTSANDLNSTLSLKIPENYDMAFAEKAGQDLVVTFVKHEEKSETFKVYIRGALRDRSNSLADPMTFKIKGNGRDNIIDFSRIDFGNNRFVAEGMEGNDTILAPSNIFSDNQMAFADLFAPHNRLQPSQYLETLVPGDGVAGADNEGVRAEQIADTKEIRLNRIDGATSNGVFLTADGFDKAYLMKDPNGRDLLVVLTKPGMPGYPPQTLLVRIENYSQFAGSGNADDFRNWLHIRYTTLVSNYDPNNPETPTVQGEPTIIPIGYETGADGRSSSGNFLDGGEGNRDFIYHYSGDTIDRAESTMEANFIPESPEEEDSSESE